MDSELCRFFSYKLIKKYFSIKFNFKLYMKKNQIYAFLFIRTGLNHY